MPNQKSPNSVPKESKKIIVAGRFSIRSPHWHYKSYAVRIHDRRTHKTYKYSTGKTTVKAAISAAIQFAEEQAKDVPTVVSITVEKAMEAWLATLHVRSSALRDYRCMLGQLKGTVHEITAAAFQKVLAERKAPRTRKKYITCTRAFYRWAIREGYAAADPTEGAKAGKLVEKERPALTPGQATALLKACRNPTKRRFRYKNRKPGEDQKAQGKRTLERLWKATVLGLYTGLRLSNVVTLRWDAANLKDRFITVKGDDSKSGRVITVPIKRELAELMATWKQGGLVIGSEVEDLGKSFDSAVKRAGEGFPRVTFHSTRHTFGSWALKATKNLALVAELLGHSRKAATVSHRYVHFEPEDLLAAVDLLPWIVTTEESPKAHIESDAPACDEGSPAPASA